MDAVEHPVEEVLRVAHQHHVCHGTEAQPGDVLQPKKNDTGRQIHQQLTGAVLDARGTGQALGHHGAGIRAEADLLEDRHAEAHGHHAENQNHQTPWHMRLEQPLPDRHTHSSVFTIMPKHDAIAGIIAYRGAKSSSLPGRKSPLQAAFFSCGTPSGNGT